ncbi:MAG: protein kinase [Acidobacteriota bacterium]
MKMIGKKISRYEIIEKIGVGGMGEVYKAHDPTLDRMVALKILPPELVKVEAMVERFVQEAKSASALNHPNILTIHEIGQAQLLDETDVIHYIAMEVIEGDTLYNKIYHEKVELKKLLDYFTQVADGLAKAHNAGIVHLDLKPKNIMITEDGYAKILDFGVAKLIQSNTATSDSTTKAPHTQTDSGMIMGTLNYMSPEQAQGKLVDQRSDIFSFGCVLYEALTRHRPFESLSKSDTFQKIVSGEPPSIKEFLPDIPAALEQIINRCLAKEISERYQSIKETAQDLRELRKEYEPGTASSAVVTTSLAGKSTPLVSVPAATLTLTPPHYSAPPVSVSIVAVPEQQKPDRRLILRLAVLTVLAVLALSLYKYIDYTQSMSESQIRQAVALALLKETKLTNNGKAAIAAISPNGQYTAYVIDDQGTQTLFIKPINGAEKILVAAMQAEYIELRFSHDDRALYYVRQDLSDRLPILYRIFFTDGKEQKLIEGINPEITLSPDNRYIAYVRNNTEESVLFIAKTDGSSAQRLAVRKIPDRFATPAWSPDGKIIACSVRNLSNARFMAVIAITVVDGIERPLSPQHWMSIKQLCWLANGNSLILLANDEESPLWQIWRLSYPEGDVRRITSDVNNYGYISLTADSRAMVTVRKSQTLNVWIMPNGETSRARLITSGASIYNGVAWSAQGRIFMQSQVSGNWDIWSMSADGSDQKQLTFEPSTEAFPTAADQDRYIIFVSDRNGKNNLWRMDFTGSNLKQLTEGSSDFSPQCTPDGKWVIYSSLVAGVRTLWRVSIEGGTPIRLTDKTSIWPSISPDGKLIACYYEDRPNHPHAIAIIPFEGGAPIKLLPLPPTANMGPFRWTPDGRAICYIDNNVGISNIWKQPLDNSAPKQLTEFNSDRIFSFDLSHDGKQLICSRGVITNDVVLINNFKW